MNKKKSLLILWAWYIVSMLFLIPLLLSYFFEENTVLSELFASLLSISLPTILLLLKQNKDGSLLFNISFEFNSTYGLHEIVLMLLGVISIFGALSYLQNAIQLINILFTEDYSKVLIYPKVNIISFFVSVIAYAIIPAIFEEILFRGIYSDAFLLDKKWIRILISISSFSAMHSPGMGTLSAVAIGFFTMLCYYKYDSILCCILVHFIYNMLGLIFTNIVSLPFSALSVLNDYANNEQIKAAIICSVGILGLCISVFFLCFLGINEKKDVSKATSLQTVSSKQNLVYNTIFIVVSLGTIVYKFVTTYIIGSN